MITLKNEHFSLTISTLGACVTDLSMDGMKLADKGMSVGRYANRIGKGTFKLGDTQYQVTKNEGENHLHGGKLGFGKKEWEVISQNDTEAVFRMVAADGEEGYPGELTLDVKYTLLENGFSVEYSAVCTKDCPVNFTNHSYFNLNGGGSARNHILWVDADSYTPVDAGLIPTGEIVPVAGTKFDFRQPRAYENDLDNNLCLNSHGYAKVAELQGTDSKLKMSVYTTEPGMQVFNTPQQVCLETQHYPDSPNHPNFPSTLLKAGEKFYSKTAYLFEK